MATIDSTVVNGVRYFDTKDSISIEARAKFNQYLETKNLYYYADTPLDEPETELNCYPTRYKATTDDKGYHLKLTLGDAADPDSAQKLGFILGEMSRSPDKPRAVTITADQITAPDQRLLEQFLDTYIQRNTPTRTAGN